MNRKFEAEVTLFYKFEVIVGENALTEEFMEEFRRYFYDFYTVEDHVEHIAQHFARSGTIRGIEGYPWIVENGCDKDYNEVEEEILKKCINVVGTHSRVEEVDVKRRGRNE